MTTPDLTRAIKRGDIITHTRYFGCIEEHVFIEWHGVAMVAEPTADTMLINKLALPASDHRVDDIYPDRVTHINRVPVCRVLNQEE